MYKYLLSLFLLTSLTSAAQNRDSANVGLLFKESLTNGKAYAWLDYLSNRIGSRLSGSESAARAVTYTEKELQNLKVDRVMLQDVMVPHWVRGNDDKAYMKSKGKKTELSCCALGMSIATPSTGIEAQIVEVTNFEDIIALGKEKIKGKIVFMNHPMNQNVIRTFTAYGEAAKYRWGTASKAAAQGAIGVVVRSMNISIDDYPHTGAMGYVDSIAKIPACAISTLDAEMLSKQLKEDPSTTVWFKQSCQTLPDAPSHNVIAEIKGSEFPDEIIVVGGHLDSWDLADGSHDDGTGVVQSMEVLNLIKATGLQPKRTIRCVLFMNEENGGKGGEKYAEESKNKKEKNIAAIESDAGGFAPRGFSFKGDSASVQYVMKFKEVLESFGLPEWEKGYGGADINHMEDQGTLLIGFSPDSQRYFDIHHSALDTFDRVNQRELQLGAASMAALAWMISEYCVK
jgi:hypothetical protein